MAAPVRATLVTSNPHKFSEIRAILAPYGIRLDRWDRALPEPQAATIEEVLGAKLRALPSRAGRYLLVEDSGISFEGLGGFPGVYSAYAYATLGLDGLLRALRGRPREARFVTVAGVRLGKRSWRFRGETRGRAAVRLRGDHGFGYDPIFIPEGERRTFAEMTESEKAARSHRGAAFRQVGDFLRRRASTSRPH